jgi:dihydrodipicolinate synthase/N-acetylneuraminate lyase
MTGDMRHGSARFYENACRSANRPAAVSPGGRAGRTRERLTGLCAGPVRAPLVDLTEAEMQDLRAILEGALGSDVG